VLLVTNIKGRGLEVVLMRGYRPAGRTLQRACSLLETRTKGLISVAFRTQA
jgi:hypothetical protein